MRVTDQPVIELSGAAFGHGDRTVVSGLDLTVRRGEVVAVGLGVTSLVVIQNSFAASTVRVESDQKLVDTGLYGLVRHPMYTAFYALHLATILATANLFLGLTWLAGLIVVISLRVDREEAMMIRQFGDAYRAYMTETDRFLPPLRRVRPA